MASKYLKRVFVNLIWLLFTILAFYLLNEYVFENKELDIIRDPNNIVLTEEMQLDSKIISLLTDRAVSYAKLSDSITIVIVPTRNFDYDSPWLHDFLKPGDVLTKRANSDTLWVKRGQKEYYFVLGKHINRK